MGTQTRLKYKPQTGKRHLLPFELTLYTEILKFSKMVSINRRKWAKDLHRPFIDEEIWIYKESNKYVKMCPTSFIIREKQVKNTVRYKLPYARLAKSKRPTGTKSGRECRGRGWCNKSPRPLWETGALSGKVEAAHTWRPAIALSRVSPGLQKSLQAGVNLKFASRFMWLKLEALAGFRVESGVGQGLVKGRTRSLGVWGTSCGVRTPWEH